MTAPKFWYRKRGIIAISLLPLSMIWWLVAMLKYHMVKPVSCAKQTIVFGNATLGGGGKTPLIRAIREYYPDDAVMIKPYPQKSTFSYFIEDTNYDMHGDEALLHYKDGRVLIVRKRKDGQKFFPSRILLDDGYQDNSIKKDKHILVVDGEIGFGNGFVAPAGPLRETAFSAYTKADVIVQIGGTEKNQDIKNLEKKYGEKLFIHTHGLMDSADLHIIRKKKIIAFAGIARNEKFFNALTKENIEIVKKIEFKDHHCYKTSELAELEKIAKNYEALLVTTEKDFVRINHICPDFATKIIYMRYKLHLCKDDIENILRLET